MGRFMCVSTVKGFCLCVNLVMLSSLSLSCHYIISFVIVTCAVANSCLRSVLSLLAFPSSLFQSFRLALRNSLGRAEELKVITSTQFPRWGQTLQLEFSKPFIRDLRKR